MLSMYDAGIAIFDVVVVERLRLFSQTAGRHEMSIFSTECDDRTRGNAQSGQMMQKDAPSTTMLDG
jgi:hypothetical protein